MNLPGGCKVCIYTHPVNSKFTIWQLLKRWILLTWCNLRFKKKKGGGAKSVGRVIQGKLHLTCNKIFKQALDKICKQIIMFIGWISELRFNIFVNVEQYLLRSRFKRPPKHVFHMHKFLRWVKKTRNFTANAAFIINNI